MFYRSCRSKNQFFRWFEKRKSIIILIGSSFEMNQEERLTFIAFSSTYPILLIFELFSLRITVKLPFLSFSVFLYVLIWRMMFRLSWTHFQKYLGDAKNVTFHVNRVFLFGKLESETPTESCKIREKIYVERSSHSISNPIH